MRPPEREGGASLIYVDLHLVHEVTSAQAFEGLRLAGPQGAAARPHARDRRPQRADRPARADGLDAITDHLSRAQVAGARAQLRGVRDPVLRHAQRAPGNRARDRPRARPLAAGHHDRLRRLPHLHARRARRARDAGRHLRGRARARDPVPAPGHGRGRCASPTRASPGFGVTAKDLILGTIGQIGAAGATGPRGRVRGRSRSRRSRSRAG